MRLSASPPLHLFYRMREFHQPVKVIKLMGVVDLDAETVADVALTSV